MATTALINSLKSGSLLPSPIIPSTFTPSYSLFITFPSKNPSNGCLVRVSDVASEPRITFSPIESSSSTSTSTDASSTFTLLLIDPDAPTPDDPKFAYWRHWVVINIPTTSSSEPNSDSVQGGVQNGKTLTPYLAPGPKDSSGPHRYLFLLFKEPVGFTVEKGDVGGDEFVERRSFGAREWVEREGLELVGVQWMRGVGDGWDSGKDEL